MDFCFRRPAGMKSKAFINAVQMRFKSTVGTCFKYVHAGGLFFQNGGGASTSSHH